MALDFSLSSPQTLLGYQVPSQPITITLTGTGALASIATFTPSGAGTFNPAAPTLPSGSIPGASVTFTYTPSAQGAITVVASGGLVATHLITIPMAVPGSTTAQQIIDQATGILQVRAVGETTGGNEAAELLMWLNTMIDGMRTQKAFAYQLARVTGTLFGATQTVTIGPSGTIVTPYRPERIEDGSFFTMTSTGGNLDYPISAIPVGSFNDIGYKTIGTIGPSAVYYEAGLPNGTLYFYPQATGPVTLTLMCLLQVSQFADLTTAYTLAPGYQRMLAYMLANEVQGNYEKQMSGAAMQNLSNAIRNVKRANMVVPSMVRFRPAGNILVGWNP